MADGSTSGPYPVTTPRRSSLERRACTVPRATPRRREISRRPTRGCSRRALMRRASSSSMVKVTRSYAITLSAAVDLPSDVVQTWQSARELLHYLHVRGGPALLTGDLWRR